MVRLQVNYESEEMIAIDVQLGDILEMKKPHPCGCNLFLVTRVGMDFKIQCRQCGHLVMVPRVKIERNIKKIVRDQHEL